MDVFGLQEYLRSSQKPSYEQLKIYKDFDGSIKKLTENSIEKKGFDFTQNLFVGKKR